LKIKKLALEHERKIYGRGTSVMWCEYGGAATEELVATKRKNGGTEEKNGGTKEKERWRRRGKVVAAKKK